MAEEAVPPAMEAAAQAAPASAAARIPTSLLAERDFIDGPKLSPDGAKMVARMNSNGKGFLSVLDFTTGNIRSLDVQGKDIDWYRWAGNDRVLVSVATMVPWENDEARMTRLLVFDLTSGKWTFIGVKSEGLIGDDVLWVDPEGKTILLSFQETIYDYPSVWSIDLATNKRRAVQPSRPFLWDWYADNAGVVRAGFIYGDNSWKMLYRANGMDSFKTVVKARNDDDDAGFDAFRLFQGSDDGYRVLLDEKTSRYALYKFNFATRQRGDLVFEAQGVDVDDFDTRYDNNALYAAWFTDDRPRVKWFEPDLEDIQSSIDKALPAGKHAVIHTLSRGRNRMMVWVGSSGDPGKFYFYDMAAGAMKFFAAVNEKLKPGMLSATTYTHCKARDGLDVPAYLTLPKGRDPKNLPLIILPHGGPYDVRDDGTFDAEVQFLANRGYVVLQPEFRGSGGYGKAYYEKGEGQWGRAMQDDLDDGMDWLAKQGIADPKRACLIGSSYGGYAALWGAVRNPERYRCAASFAGISDLGKQLKYQVQFKVSKRYRKDWRKTVQGDETVDLKALSPLYMVDKLQVPVLMVHGDEDSTVPIKQSRVFAEALKNAGKPYEYYVLKGEQHGFSTSANMQLWLDKLDAFLGKYNPAD